MANTESFTLISPVARASFVQLVKPKANISQPGSAPKFSLNLIFDPEDAQIIYAAIMDVATRAFGADAAGMIAREAIKQPLKDGSKPNKKTGLIDPTTNGKYFITAKSNEDRQPICFAQDGGTVLNPSAIYSGCYVRAELNFFSFTMPTASGVSVGANFIQFVKDGEKLAGAPPTVAEGKTKFGAAPGYTGPAAGAGGTAGGLPNFGMGGATAPIGSLGLPS